MNDITSQPPAPPVPQPDAFAPQEVQPPLDSAFSLPPDSTAYYTDIEIQRNRLTSFFRIFTVLPHAIWLAIYGIAAFFALIAAWFAIVFTAKYPAGLYSFIADYHRYYTRVYAYGYLVTDKFPPFSGSADEPYAAHFLVGPPKEQYSRVKTFFRGLLIIPFGIVGYAFNVVFQIVAVVVWFAILFTGKQSEGLQGVFDFCFGYLVRLGCYGQLLTEDWPKFTDKDVNVALQERGYVGTIPPSA